MTEQEFTAEFMRGMDRLKKTIQDNTKTMNDHFDRINAQLDEINERLSE